MTAVSATSVAALAACAVLAGPPAALAQSQADQITPIQKATLATFASAGCLMLAVSRTYSPARSTDDIAALSERDCDKDALEVPHAQAAAGVANASTDAAAARTAAKALAKTFAEQIRNATSAPVVRP